MYDCERGEGNFLYWKRPEREYLASELVDVIEKSMLYGCSAAVVRSDWDELMQGDLRERHGDAESYCVRICYMMAHDWAIERRVYDNQLALVFDNRPHRSADNQAIFKAFDEFQQGQAHQFKYNFAAPIIGPWRGPARPELASLTFASSKKFRGLQAADLLAWESYRGALSAIKTFSDAPQSANLQRLIKTRRFARTITTRKELLAEAKREKLVSSSRQSPVHPR